MAVATSILARLGAVRTVALDLGAIRESPKTEVDISWPTGTGVSQADEVWSEIRSLAVGTENLELDNLAQLDNASATQRTVTFSVLKAILIVNTSTSGRLVLGGGSTGLGAADAFAGTGYPFAADDDKIEIPFGGFFFWADPTGVAVTNGASDILHVEAIGATQTYDIIIVGED